MIVWRLVKTRHADAPLSADGAQHWGGRWNPVGVPVLYCSQSLALAALEVLVHVRAGMSTVHYHAAEIEIPAESPTALPAEALPPTWRKIPCDLATQKLGGAWADAGESLALAVPSVIVPSENNVLLNPATPTSARFAWYKPSPFHSIPDWLRRHDARCRGAGERKDFQPQQLNACHPLMRRLVEGAADLNRTSPHLSKPENANDPASTAPDTMPPSTTQPPPLRFPTEVFERLQEAVDTDDIIDPSAPLPASFLYACPDATVRACYALCLQFWVRCADRATMVRVVNQLLRGRAIDDGDRHAYKQIRASYKHLRFAQRLYFKRHKADTLFWWTTGTMGDLQDAFKNGARGSVLRHGIVLRLLLTRPVWAWIRWRAGRGALDSAAGLLRYRRARMQRLQASLSQPLLTGVQFHALRKIVSQQVSYYDTLYALQPSDDLLRAMRYVGHINGLMGARHDAMVADALAGRRRYGTPEALAAAIRLPLAAFTAGYAADRAV